MKKIFLNDGMENRDLNPDNVFFPTIFSGISYPDFMKKKKIFHIYNAFRYYNTDTIPGVPLPETFRWGS